MVESTLILSTFGNYADSFCVNNNNMSICCSKNPFKNHIQCEVLYNWLGFFTKGRLKKGKKAEQG